MTRFPRAAALWLALTVALPWSAAAQTKDVGPGLRRQIRHAMDRGLGVLMGGPVKDLATRGPRKPSDGLCLYAALHAGGRRDSKLIRAASDSLAKQNIKRTYEAACAIMALDLSDSARYADRIRGLAGFLQRTQKKGAWGYPGSEDLSNTQYAALGLWRAHRGGFSVQREVWVKLAKALPDFQTEAGGFGYHRGGGGATVSMTAAGIACVEICLRMLGQDDGSTKAWAEDELHGLRVMEARAIEWMADKFDAGQGIRVGPALGVSFYALYGTERAAELTGTQYLGEHDWYEEGALSLIGTQDPGGYWGGNAPAGIDTSFAILFLARATRKASAPLSGPTSSKSHTGSDQLGLKAPPESEAFRSALAKLHRRDLGRNLLPSMKPSVLASSHASSHPPRLLWDTRRTTWWSPRSGVAQARLKLSFDKGKSIDTILIAGARESQTAPLSGAPPQAIAPPPHRLLVRVNGRPYPVIMPKDPRRKARLELAEPVVLETLEVVRVEVGDADHAAPLRLGEIEAQLR